MKLEINGITIYYVEKDNITDLLKEIAEDIEFEMVQNE